jgi:hypothetical protein
LSKKTGVSGPFASLVGLDELDRAAGGALRLAVTGRCGDDATNERAPKKPIDSHFFLCSRALRTASFAGSRPP